MLGISADKELWIETKTAEGKSYFYQSETRQTVWEKPEPPAVVMQQDEIQRMVEQSQRDEKGWLLFDYFFKFGFVFSFSYFLFFENI